jgi:hypothetical protein
MKMSKAYDEIIQLEKTFALVDRLSYFIDKDISPILEAAKNPNKILTEDMQVYNILIYYQGGFL